MPVPARRSPLPCTFTLLAMLAGVAAAGTAVAGPAPGGAQRGAPASVLPLDGARSVQRLVQPRLRFDSARGALDALHAGVELLGPLGIPVGLVRRVSGDTLRLEPALPLADCTRYTLRLRGRASSAWHSRFRTACSRWSEPLQIDDRRSARRPGRGAREVQLASAAGGDVLAAWFQSDGRRSAIEASRYVADTDSWQAPRAIDLPHAGGSTLPALVTLADGRVLAAWVQQLHGHAELLARVLGGADAGAPKRLDAPGLRAGPGTVQLAADAAGHAVAVWQQPDARHTAVWAAYWNGRRWSRARELDTAAPPDYAPVVAGAGDDLFVAAWERGRDGHERVAASRWLGRAWSAPRRLSARGAHARRPLLALDAAGRVGAAWIQGDGDARRIALRRMQLRPWRGAAARTARAPGLRAAAVAAAIAFDPAGNLALAWEQQARAGSPDVIEAARWMRGAAAPQPGTRIDPAGQRSAGNPVLVSDPAGNLVCAWYQDTTQGLQVLAARFDAARAQWQPAQLLSDPRGTVQASFPALTVDAAGSVSAAWQQFNGWRNVIVASRLR